MKWLAAGTLLVLIGAIGCGSQYRPVINPIQPTGPATQPNAYAVVLSQPGLVSATAATPTASSPIPPCPATAYSSAAVATILDFSGDSIAAQATLGNGPLTFALSAGAGSAFSPNCDGTLSDVTPIGPTLMTKDVGSSTLLADAVPINALALTSALYVVEQGRDAIASMTGAPPSLKVEVPVAPSVINATGSSASQRIYSISQGNSNAGGGLAWGACGTPSSVSITGEADAIEIATNNISNRIPLGVCPVYGITSADGNRAFILNRGSGTITVINSQMNQLDTGLNATGTINLCGGVTPCNAGPVYADLYTTASLLVVSNYDNNTVSVINTSLDIYGNDSPNFGKVLATVPVGSHPAAVTVLQDGSRAYVANEGDATVSVVNLTSFTAEKTIPLTAPATAPNALTGTTILQPRSIVSSYNYPYGKVYVTAQNSEYVTIIRTDTDIISAAIQVQGEAVDVRTTSQYAGIATNALTQSRSVGSGAP
jgi:DNA-binding beta-propeller fold protein YncE